jgi:hypothetical protein
MIDSQPRTDAKRVLRYYFQRALKDLFLTGDEIAEIDDIVDDIIQAAVEEVREELKRD